MTTLPPQPAYCEGFVVVRARDPAFATFFLAFGIAASLAVLAATGVWLVMRRSYLTLRQYSLVPIIFGGFLAPVLVLVRAYFTFVGREHLACRVAVVMVYALIPITAIADFVAMTQYTFRFEERQNISSKQIERIAIANARAAVAANTRSVRSASSASSTRGNRHSVGSNGVSNNNARGRGSVDGYYVRAGKSATETETRISVERSPPVDFNRKTVTGGIASVTMMDDERSVISSKADEEENGKKVDGFLTTWFKEFFNFLFVFFPKRFHFKLEERKYRRVSKLRLLSFELGAWLVYCHPLMIALGVRLRTDDRLGARSQRGCYGCQLFWEDLLITSIYASLIMIPISLDAYQKRKYPDPLVLRRDFLYVVVVSVPVLAMASLLNVFDPGDMMKSQFVDWHIFEVAYIVLDQVTRTLAKLHRVRRNRHRMKSELRLLDILQDAHAASMFEKFLKAELAFENLQFWRTATKWRASYDKSGSVFLSNRTTSTSNAQGAADFNYTQQMARVLVRTFIGKNAQIPINVSDELAEAVLRQFKKFKVVGREVFDDCLVEVYKLMENGAFQRFVKTKEFREYSKNMVGAEHSLIYGPLVTSVVVEAEPGHGSKVTTAKSSNARGSTRVSSTSDSQHTQVMSIQAYIEEL